MSPGAKRIQQLEQALGQACDLLENAALTEQERLQVTQEANRILAKIEQLRVA